MTDFENPPVIDGVIDKQEWPVKDSVSALIQLEPDNGKESTRQTIIFAGQDKENIYFAFKCYIHNQNEITAKIQRRDMVSDSDDAVALLLDTYNDKRTSLLFLVNAIGTLSDTKVADDGKNLDSNWDTEWEARTSQDDSGWYIEIRIPFESIHFVPGRNNWGVNFGRFIRANQETAWWTSVTENFRVSQGGRLTSIYSEGKPKHGLRLFPYGTVRYEDSDETGNYDKFIGDAGIDLVYDMGSNLTANLSYNPDFATVEGDKELINLTPWELRFPDKRLFFQDGNEMFKTRISTFYSRRIGDIDFGGKLIGKAGKYQFNALSALTKEDIDAELPRAMHNAVKVKRDFLNSSIIGLTYADKIWKDNYVRSLSLDYVLNLGRTWKLTGQFVGSAPGDFASHSAWFVRFARENNIYHYHIRYSSFGKNFQENVNQTGFIQDDDRHELDSDIRYRWWINKNIRYLQVEGRNNIFWSQAGALRSWYLTYNSKLYMQNRLSADIAYNNEYKLLDKEYYNHFYRFIIGYNTDEWAHAQAGFTSGHNFDRDFDLWNLAGRVLLFKKLSLTYELNVLQYDPDLTESSTLINVLGADYFFTKDLWIRIFTQNNSSIDKYYFYGLFGWRFKPPFGALYFIMSSDQYVHFDPEFEEIYSNIAFLKLTYPLIIL
ncbi:DUF5916 domain-containing protein [Bacteroidota bacterium]